MLLFGDARGLFFQVVQLQKGQSRQGFRRVGRFLDLAELVRARNEIIERFFAQTGLDRVKFFPFGGFFCSVHFRVRIDEHRGAMVVFKQQAPDQVFEQRVAGVEPAANGFHRPLKKQRLDRITAGRPEVQRDKKEHQATREAAGIVFAEGKFD